MAAEEDLDYTVDEFATPDKTEEELDADQVNKSVLYEVVKHLNMQLKKHNSLDLVEPNAENIMTTQQQVQVQKEIVVHLNEIRTMIVNKIKELK